MMRWVAALATLVLMAACTQVIISEDTPVASGPVDDTPDELRTPDQAARHSRGWRKEWNRWLSARVVLAHEK